MLKGLENEEVEIDERSLHRLVGRNSLFELRPLPYGSNVVELLPCIDGQSVHSFFPDEADSNVSLLRNSAAQERAGDDATELRLDCLLLRAPSPLPSGRVPLLGCKECGSISCGVISVRIHEFSNCFCWSNFCLE